MRSTSYGQIRRLFTKRLHLRHNQQNHQWPEAHLSFEACSVNYVATREKYFCILSHRLGLGMQPLCAWMAWIRAISLAINLKEERRNRLPWLDFNRKCLQQANKIKRLSCKICLILYSHWENLATPPFLCIPVSNQLAYSRLQMSDCVVLRQPRRVLLWFSSLCLCHLFSYRVLILVLWEMLRT